MNHDHYTPTGADVQRQWWAMTALGNICWLWALQAIWRLSGLAVLACLLAIPPPTRAGSIDYTFTDAHYPNSVLGRMEVDDAALTRGYIATEDVKSFAFYSFSPTDPMSFGLPIEADGSPTPGGAMITGREVVFRTTYRLQIDWGGELGGFWQVASGGSPGINGYGYWTETLIPGDPAVPCPPSVIMGLVGLVFILFVRGWRR